SRSRPGPPSAGPPRPRRAAPAARPRAPRQAPGARGCPPWSSAHRSGGRAGHGMLRPVLRRIGIVLTVGGVVLFVISFLHIVTGNVPSECGGAECLRGENRWLLALPASVFAFVGGVIMI